MTTNKLRSRLAVAACAALLAACGGGGGGSDNGSLSGPEAVDMVPISAAVSSEAYTRFAGTLINSDRSQPLGMDQLIPPTSESDLPLALN